MDGAAADEDDETCRGERGDGEMDAPLLFLTSHVSATFTFLRTTRRLARAARRVSFWLHDSRGRRGHDTGRDDMPRLQCFFFFSRFFSQAVQSKYKYPNLTSTRTHDRDSYST